MKFFSSIILFALTLSVSGCSVYGTYKSRFNDGYNGGWIKLKKSNTFEFIAFNHISGYGYTQGRWIKKNDSIYLKELEKKPPKTNALEEINDGNKSIKILNLSNDPILPHYIKINGILDSIYSDWDGNYSYDGKYEEVDEIQIFDMGNVQNELGQLLAEFKPKCKTCSYKINIDWDNVGFANIYGLDTIWVYKKNRLYPTNSNDFIKSQNKTVSYKKIDTLKPSTFWLNSWNEMKKGYD